MTDSAYALNPSNAVALAAIAAITGQSVSSATEMFSPARQVEINTSPARREDIQRAVDRLCTRVGLAPALTQQERENHIRALRGLPCDDFLEVTHNDLDAGCSWADK